ncbi:hypothetical protein QFZ97_004742 [Paraburkholderia youngii]
MNATREPVELSRATHLLNHGPVTLITSAHAGRSNVMAASWAAGSTFFATGDAFEAAPVAAFAQ